MATKPRVKVYCKTLDKYFDTLSAAASFANENPWTMGVKMATAGYFKGKDGNVYERLTPLISKRNYKNTGPTIIREQPKGIKRKKVTDEPQEDSTLTKVNEFVDTGKVTEISMKYDVFTEVDKLKSKIYTMVKERQIKLLKDSGIYEEYEELQKLLDSIMK